MKKFFVFLITLICIAGTSLTTAQEKNQQAKKKKKVNVSGFVKDQAGFPVSGISIFVDSKKTSAITNDIGFYKVKVKPDVKVLSAFSLMGGAHEVEFKGQEIINFTLGETMDSNISTEDTDDKVNTGYSDVSKDELTTSVGSVEISDDRHYRNIYEMISGEVPGVHVSGNRIRIRSKSSISQSVEPLIILNDVIVTDLDGILPISVKSINILKGPATAIYGARGADGVILIKTK